MWVASAGLQLAANAAVAALIGSASGYRGGSSGYVGGFMVWKFMLFYIARPRLSWIILGFLGTTNMSCGRLGRRDGGPIRQGHNQGEGEDNPYWCAAKSQLIAELVLQAMACYVMGAIVQQGSQNSAYNMWSDEVPDVVRLMYAGALYFVVLGGISLVALIWVLLMMAVDRDSNTTRNYTRIVLFMFLLSTWLGSWLFWGGFVNFMARVGFYCPQKLASQAIIWVSFSLLGIITH
jgi:hypothetical protein